MSQQLKKGQRVRFDPPRSIVRHHPDDARYLGEVGVVEEEGSCPRVVMDSGYVLTGWRNERFTAVTTPGHILLESVDQSALYATRHADLAAAIQWLQDNGCTGRFRVLHVTEGKTLTASRETKTVVRVNE